MADNEVIRDAADALSARSADNATSASAFLEESSKVTQKKTEKDPRKIARKYQAELCKKALEENIIVCLETGCGKTHIAVMLVHEFGQIIRKPQRSVCVFLAPTVALVNQQAKVIEDSTDFKVGIYCGSPSHLKSHADWANEIENYEVLVMTPQTLLHNLSHSFIKMDFIALLIFDECHHAQTNSSHPYTQIMKIFYKTKDGKSPRIFGMTASPVVGKGSSNEESLAKSINSLENLLDAKVYSVEDKDELGKVVASPVIKIYPYGPLTNGMASAFGSYRDKLEGIKAQCISELGKKVDDLQGLRSSKKVLRKMHANMIACLENLGLWGALQSCQILLSGDHPEWDELIGAEGAIHDTYLAQAAQVFSDGCTRDGISCDLSNVEALKEPFFSIKLLRLIGILSNFRVQPNMKCIVFVNRIVTARSLSSILQSLKFLTSWRCDFLVGVHSGLKSMSRTTMNSILQKFQTGQLNLLVATKVGEEGLDIQTCCLVIRFDLPETVTSFIQSRGRARMPQSEYAFLVDRGNQKELDLIENFKRDEYHINLEISSRTSEETFDSPEERVYNVDTSGASISSGYSISLLHHYCSKLSHDEYFDPKPKFFYVDDLGGTVCHIVLPSNAALHEIVGTPQSSTEAAKRDSCLKAIEQLHKLGALNDFLLPEQGDMEESLVVSSSFESCEDEGSQGELHEMLVPAVLKGSWTNLNNLIQLESYYIEFCPVPNDRTYKMFGLFVKAPLPHEAEKMEVDLHLARGRCVKTKLISLGPKAFNKDEIVQAQNFQEMFLKVILDRSEFVHEFVPLGEDGICESSQTFYLLLPIVLQNCQKRMTVDWEMVRRCLSSPVFRSTADDVKKKIPPLGAYLQLANGCTSIGDIEHSLVFAVHAKRFYFITNIVPEKNAYSPFKDSSGTSHMEHLACTFGIRLKYPEQHLLQAKQLFSLRNLLHNRKQEDSESQEMDEYFIDLVPELCELKILGFSKDMGSSISLLPSIMHRLENLLVAIELKCLLFASFPEAAAITANRVLEALTTERCQERLSLERLETLGDSFLKFAITRHLFLLYDTIDEGELTRQRSNAVNNFNLFRLACRRNLQVYIRDQPFEPSQFFALGRPCPRICTKELEGSIHGQYGRHAEGQANTSEVRCRKGHHWLYKKTIADVVEALVGAFVVDSGFKATMSFLRWIGIKVDFEASQVIKVCLASSRYIPLASSSDVDAFVKNLLGYEFFYKGLLLQAFVHPSYNKHGGGCYQRLEFLGDAVLDHLITTYLYSVYPKLKPGHLTDLRSALVNNRAFAKIAIDQSFHKFLICDSNRLREAIKDYVEFVKTPPLERDSLEGPKCPKVLGDLVESFIGAICLEKGFDLNYIWKLMLSFLNPIVNLSNVQLSPVRELQELCQSQGWNLQFPTLKKGRMFLVEARVNGKDMHLHASSSHSSRKEAVRIASEQIFEKLKDQGYTLKSDYLEKILRNTDKMEPKLIGYDECQINVTADVPNLMVQGHSDREPKQPPSPTELIQGQSSHAVGDRDTKNPGRAVCVTARSQLYEICAANCWSPPVFECCHEEGPSHLKSFTCKVVVEVEAAPTFILECFSAPHSKKKAAAEHAAEGALKYLEQEGFLR